MLMEAEYQQKLAPIQTTCHSLTHQETMIYTEVIWILIRPLYYSVTLCQENVSLTLMYEILQGQIYITEKYPIDTNPFANKTDSFIWALLSSLPAIDSE